MALLLVGRQLGEGGADGVGFFPDPERAGGVGVAGGGGGLELRGGRGQQFAAAPAHADPVDGAVAGEGGGPAEHRTAAGVVGGRLVPHLEKNVLHDVLGFGGVVGDAERQRVERPGERIVEAGERSPVTAGHRSDECSSLGGEQAGLFRTLVIAGVAGGGG